MKTNLLKLLCFLFVLGVFSFHSANGQLAIPDENPVLVDFTGFAGTGIIAAPAAGELNSNDWSVLGASDGDLDFGADGTTGDYGRGISTGGVGTGGIYAFDVGSGNITLGVQPTSGDYSPVAFILKIQNTTGLDIVELNISYSVWVLNDQDRGNSFNFSHSADNVSYTDESSLDYTSPDALDASGWTEITRNITLLGLSIANNDFYYLKWSGDDVSGSGSRDEFGLDDISITGLNPTPDFDPPVFASGYPKTDDVKDTRFDVVVNLDERGTVYYLVLNAGDPEPNMADVREGDTIVIQMADADYSATVSPVTPATGYDIYFLAEDDEATPNVQDTTTFVTVTTALQRELTMTYPVGGENFYVGDTVKVTWTSANIDSLKLYVDIFEGDGWNTIDDGESKIGADLGEWPVEVPLSAGVDSVRMLLADASDFSFNDSSGVFYLTDTIKPRVHRLDPLNKSLNVSILPELTIYFNEWVDPGTGNITIHKDDGTLVETIDAAGSQVEIVNDQDYMARIQTSVRLANETAYYVMVDAGTFLDFQGNAFEGISSDTVWTFTTVAMDIFFSEYIEGSGSNKALEILNATTSDIDLSGYQIWRANNGALWENGEKFQLGGILKADSLFVICNVSADSVLKARSDSVGGPLGGATNYGGDDAVGIFKFVDGNWILIDAIGEDGNDPGTAWDVAGVTNGTKEHTLVRKDFIVTGNPDWESSAGTNGFDSEWKVYDQDYFDNIGLPSPPSNTSAEIDSFMLAEQTGPAVINSSGATVDIEVIKGTDRSALAPMVYISEMAMVDPASGEVVDFSQGAVVYTVTAEDRVTTKDWTVTVTEAEQLSSEKDIITFVLTDETKAAVIDATAHTVTAEVKYGTALTALAPTIEVSAGATISPASGVAQDFSAGAVTYTVTAQDASTQEWAVTVVAVAPVEVANLAALRAATVDNETIYKVTGEVILTGFMDYRGRKYLQDATAAIEIDDDVNKAVTTTYSVGDGITGLTGTLENYFGWLEIHPVDDPGAPTSTGNTITPKTVTIDDFKSNFENHEAQLIRIDTVDIEETGNFKNGDTLHISRDGEKSILFVNFYATDLTGSPIPAAANVTGIAYWHYGQAKIVPRFKADVVAVEKLPDRVEDLLSDEMVRIYPNPGSGVFTLELNRNVVADLEVEIHTLNGRMVYRNSYRSVATLQDQIDLNDLSPGIYLIKLRSADRVSMQKLVIQ